MEYKFLFLIFFVFLLVPLIAAEGLNIIGQSNFTVEKIVGQDKIVMFTLENQEYFSFYNISFEENSFIKMDTIPELLPVQNININATIYEDFIINQSIRIQGFYEAGIGESNQNYIVDIIGDDVAEPCELSIIVGDSVIWKNLLVNNVNVKIFDEIVMYNNNISRIFENPQIFKYTFLVNDVNWFLWPPQHYCQITVIDDIGSVNNPDFDAFIKLNIITEYESTTLYSYFPSTNYSMEFYSVQEGIFSITNTGSEIAYNINLDNEWFTFNKNNFNLGVGITENVGYSIKPQNYIKYTNHTNKIYYKELTIKGNFPEIAQDFQIYINYADIDTGNYTSGFSLIDAIKKYCVENPGDELCPQKPSTIYPSSNETDDGVLGALKGIFQAMFKKMDEDANSINVVKEQSYNISQSITEITTQQNETNYRLDTLEKEKGIYDSLLIVVVSFILLIMVCGIMSGIFLYVKKKRKAELMTQMGSGVFKRIWKKKKEK